MVRGASVSPKAARVPGGVCAEVDVAFDPDLARARGAFLRPPARFPPLEAFRRRPPDMPRRPSSGRHPKPCTEAVLPAKSHLTRSGQFLESHVAVLRFDSLVGGACRSHASRVRSQPESACRIPCRRIFGWTSIFPSKMLQSSNSRTWHSPYGFIMSVLPKSDCRALRRAFLNKASIAV